MPTSLLRFTALAAGLLMTAAAGWAETSPAQIRTQKTLEEVVVDLSAKGYLIREIEMDDGHFEATVVDPQNVVSKAVIDGTTGEIRRIERKR
ncbi:PepSY domain-containing protein [Shinella pollutisoli]|uniref:PepSY domain-containing protein n=1 Tax=Shinella pollutisoli TaxID=2250594 RepID=A0ABV7DIG4_9HYPH|nr:PepSY domain-containing protein [Shinella pollutisoli]